MDPRRLFSSPTSSSPLETFSAEFSSIHFHTFNFRLPMLSGFSPENKFDDKFKALRLERRVIEVGIGPLMRLSDKSMNVRFEWKDFGIGGDGTEGDSEVGEVDEGERGRVPREAGKEETGRRSGASPGR
uniref:Uncharacterized protein n=1 Tax=Brassica campestris TaxID=3711 RepID=A0A3P5Y465_BRACM|nr:unnamed protein product [Brassica rapa]